MKITTVSMHTSPWTQLGAGDGGGMNVVVRHTAEELASLGFNSPASVDEETDADDLWDSVMSVPPEFDERGVICINGHPAPRALWGLIRPRPAAVTKRPELAGKKVAEYDAEGAEAILGIVEKITGNAVQAFITGLIH